MTGRLALVTAPAEWPILADFAKRYVRVETDADFDILETFVAAATRYYDGPDGILGRALITQTWDYTIDDGFPTVVEAAPYGFVRGGIRLPLPPLQSVTSVTYGATPTVWSSTLYTVIKDSFEPAIVPVINGTFPADEGYPVIVRFVAGYGNAHAVPHDIKIAIARRAAMLYEHREPVVVGATVSPIEGDIDAALASYKVWTSA